MMFPRLKLWIRKAKTTFEILFNIIQTTAVWKKNTCIVLFFPSWVLDSRLKFAFGCLGAIFLGKKYKKSSADTPGNSVLRIRDIWYGSGSPDPPLLLTDLDPDPAIFVSDLQDGN
jgi:hypothetical protein